jgi:hypothetical protein
MEEADGPVFEATIVWNGSARSMARTITPPLVQSRYVSNDCTLRQASAQQCWQIVTASRPW